MSLSGSTVGYTGYEWAPVDIIFGHRIFLSHRGMCNPSTGVKSELRSKKLWVIWRYVLFHYDILMGIWGHFHLTVLPWWDELIKQGSFITGCKTCEHMQYIF